MSESPARVLVVGDVMTDIIVKPEGPLVMGSDRRAAIRSRPGGSGANQAVWLGAFGVPVSFAARVAAADKFHLETYFKGFRIDPILVGDRDLPSGVLVTIVSPDGERSFLTDRGANQALSVLDLGDELLDGTRLVVVSGYSYFSDTPRAAVIRLARQALKRDIAVAIDPASVGFLEEVGVENFIGWTRGASLLFANAQEAETLTGETGLEAQMRALGAHYRRVIIKRGRDGAAMGSAEGVQLTMAAPEVEVVDTTGAGDAFAAGFIAARGEGRDDAASLAAAIAAGAKAVQHIGGQPVG